MNDLITNLIAAATKLAVVGAITGTLLTGYVESIRWVCPHLRAATNAAALFAQEQANPFTN